MDRPGRGAVWMCGRLLLLVGFASGMRLSKEDRSNNHPRDICRVRQDVSDGAPSEVRVMALSGNRRSVAFGDAGKDTETTVSCAAAEEGSGAHSQHSCATWPQDRPPVADVSECPACPCAPDVSRLSSASNELLFSVGVGPACAPATPDKPVDVLLFGLGGGAVHAYTLAHCPKAGATRVESVEADPRLAAIAEKYFGVPIQAGLSEVDTDDASAAAANLVARLPMDEGSGVSLLGRGSSRSRAAHRQRRGAETPAAASESVPALGERPWDVIAVDCFVDKGVTPINCRSETFVGNLKLLAKPGGKLLHHLWHSSPYDSSVAPTFKETLALYQRLFGADNVQVMPVNRPAGYDWDSVLVVTAGAP